MGVFFIFLGMIPAIYIWSTVPNHNKPHTPIPPTPTPISVNNIQFNTDNDYLYDYWKQPLNTLTKINKYISLEDNQYIYYDNENKINFINSEGKTTPIENQKVAKAIGKFDNKELIILKENENINLGLINNNYIEYFKLNNCEVPYTF